jgi:hypothetical protein
MYRLALASGVNAAKQHDQWERVAFEPPLHLEQLHAQPGNLGLVVGLGNRAIEFGGLEHGK